MKLIADIKTKTWLFEEEEVFPYSTEIKIGFRNGGDLPVIFDNLSFGYYLTSDNKIFSEKTKPEEETSYIYTDQECVEIFFIEKLMPKKEYMITVWAENSDQFWQESFTFSTPEIKSPYPSWTYDENQGFWIPPIPYPDDNLPHMWDEESNSWKNFPKPPQSDSLVL